MRNSRNRFSCGCTFPSLDGHAAHATGLTVNQALPDVLKAARKEHVRTSADVDWDAYRRHLSATLGDVLERHPAWGTEDELDPDQARDLVLAVHSPAGLDAIRAAVVAATA